MNDPPVGSRRAASSTSSARGMSVWVLRHRGTEIADGQPFTTDPNLSRARIDSFAIPAEAVDPVAQARAETETALARRFGSDYSVLSAASASGNDLHVE